jgi:hypothetical protein
VTQPTKGVGPSELGVAFAVGSLQSGGLLCSSSEPSHDEQLEALAATLPEIFGTVDPACLDRIAMRLCGETSGEGFAEVLLLSELRLHVARPLVRQENRALVAVSSATHRIGLVLSEVHARAAALEDDS